ncbi:MAG: GPR endopeptidase [Clostridia bacterium]|nr:GPR endopeptidase [Clostridia bacterium]
MFQKRTDLALEVHELHGNESGITVHEFEKDGFNLTIAEVSSGKGEEISKKRAGKYITVEIGRIWQKDREVFERVAKLISEEIQSLLPENDGCVLVAGLGNEEITPDSLGPRVVKKLLVTRHIQAIDRELFVDAGFGCVAALSPGVLGQTGIESSEIIKSVCKSVKPKCVIVIDSLASRRLNRLASTVQISDGGISPGSGVSNRRPELNESTLGAPVISIGVPTVVDAATLAYDLLEEHSGQENEGFAEVIERVLVGSGKDMFVTPKENDVIARETAKLLACAINMAVHKMGIKEIDEFID